MSGGTAAQKIIGGLKEALAHVRASREPTTSQAARILARSKVRKINVAEHCAQIRASMEGRG